MSHRVIALFALVVFLRFFHAAADARMDLLEQRELGYWCVHARFVSLQLILLAVDVTLAWTLISGLFVSGPSVDLLFAFELAVMSLNVLLVIVRYCLHRVDQQIEGQWVNKGTYALWGSLIINIVRLMLHVTYFALVCMYFSMPLVMLRDVYVTFFAVVRDLKNVQATQRLRQQLTRRAWVIEERDLTELHDHTCLICRLNVSGDGASVILPCRHSFHVNCLLPWFEQSQTCPACRAEVNADGPPYLPEWRRPNRNNQEQVQQQEWNDVAPESENHPPPQNTTTSSDQPPSSTSIPPQSEPEKDDPSDGEFSNDEDDQEHQEALERVRSLREQAKAQAELAKTLQQRALETARLSPLAPSSHFPVVSPPASSLPHPASTTTSPTSYTLHRSPHTPVNHTSILHSIPPISATPPTTTAFPHTPPPSSSPAPPPDASPIHHHLFAAFQAQQMQAYHMQQIIAALANSSVSPATSTPPTSTRRDTEEAARVQLPESDDETSEKSE